MIAVVRSYASYRDKKSNGFCKVAAEVDLLTTSSAMVNVTTQSNNPLQSHKAIPSPADHIDDHIHMGCKLVDGFHNQADKGPGRITGLAVHARRTSTTAATGTASWSRSQSTLMKRRARGVAPRCSMLSTCSNWGRQCSYDSPSEMQGAL